MHRLSLGKAEFSDAEVVAFARELLSNYQGPKSLLKAFETTAKGNKTLERLATSFRLSRSADMVSTAGLRNVHLVELMKLVAFGVERNVNMKRTLALFANRLDYEIRISNRFRAKTGSLQMLTYMGMGIFFPLFAGISSIILSSSTGLFENSALLLGRSFIAVSLLYVLIILYLTSAFAHPEAQIPQTLLSILPYFLTALGVIFITQSYLANVL